MKRNPAPWITDNMHALRSQRDSVYRKWRKNKEQADYERHCRLRNKIKLFVTPKLDTHIRFSRIKYLQNPHGTV